MSVAYWCVLVSAVLPYVWVIIAKRGVPGYNNKDPRGWVARQDSYLVRNAYGAHLNALEAFPVFAAAVVMAQFALVDRQWITWLALAFVAFRILHGVFYLTATHQLRSLSWFAGFGCAVALMVLAALKVAA